MAKHLTCPYCWHSFREEELFFACGDACPQAEKVRFKADEAGKKGLCPHGRRPMPRRFCPNDDCRRPLLREYLESSGRSVAVIGSADAGKTTYIGVLLHELGGRVSQQFNGMAVDLLGEESRRNYEERFREPLFERGEAVRATARLQGGDLDPLIFALRIPETGFLHRGGLKSIVTVFYDSSGENVLTANAMDPLARYLEGAGGIVVLIDPMQMPRVRQTFGGGAMRGAPIDQVAVIQRLAELLKESTKASQKRLEIPLAVVITKVDMLRDGFDEQSPLRRHSSHEGYYDDADGADVHEEMRGWLEHWFGPALDNSVAANFSDHRYFGVSALGAPPRDQNRLAASGIQPYRVEDPILWLLADFGSIKKVKK